MLQKRTSLIICDDNEGILDVTKLVLEAKGYRVEALVNCENYLEKIKKLKPDLLLLDIWMPKQTGDAITKTLKAHQQFKDLPIVLFSANNDIEKVAKQCGADGFIRKPFDMETIGNVIESVTKNESNVK